MYVDEDFAINLIQPNFLRLLLTGKFGRSVTEILVFVSNFSM